MRRWIGSVPALCALFTALTPSLALAEPPTSPPTDAGPAPTGEPPPTPPAAPAPVGANGKEPETLEVTVLGESDDALQKVPGSRTMITPKEIERTAPIDTTELLRQIPSV